MKQTFLSVLLTFVMFGVTFNSFAQRAQHVSLTEMHRQNDRIAVTLTSPEGFYVGGNVHVLYIGDKQFDIYDQGNDEQGEGKLIYYIPEQDFKKLKSGDRMYLSYGTVTFKSEEEFDGFVAADPERHWKLGTLDKSMLH